MGISLPMHFCIHCWYFFVIILLLHLLLFVLFLHSSVIHSFWSVHHLFCWYVYDSSLLFIRVYTDRFDAFVTNFPLFCPSRVPVVRISARCILRVIDCDIRYSDCALPLRWYSCLPLVHSVTCALPFLIAVRCWWRYAPDVSLHYIWCPLGGFWAVRWWLPLVPRKWEADAVTFVRVFCSVWLFMLPDLCVVISVMSDSDDLDCSFDGEPTVPGFIPDY